jgi:N-acetyl-alpha-D-muramate 1-phosphate uridylyltransferase
MQTVILAGGLGTRIRSIAGNLPKSLIPVAGRPFIGHQLDLLTSSGQRDIVLCLGVGADQVERYVRDGAPWGLRVRCLREDPGQLLGTGGALVHALPLLDEQFMVLYGDSYLPLDYRAFVSDFEQRELDASTCVYRNLGRWDRSNVRVEQGRVVFYSKSARPGEADYIDYGLTAYRKRALEAFRHGPVPLDLERVWTDLIQRNALGAFVVSQRFYEIGSPEGLRELDEHLRGTVAGLQRGKDE